jgi:predicted enzyme related to lactoylglutathione lyase
MGRPVTQFQILSKQPDAAARFYCALFGWRIDANNPLGYRRIDTGSELGIQGGIWPSPPEGHAFVQLFVEVDDVAGHVARCKSLGGACVVPPQRLPDGGEMAVLLDPEGIPVALWRPAPRA